MPFPAEAVPDGTTLAAHHAIWGAALVLWSATYAWDGFTDREPLALSFGAFFTGGSFMLLWPRHPVAGALASFVGIAIMAGGLFRFRDYATRTAYLVAGFGILASLDDIVEHAFDIWTPLDWFFVRFGPEVSLIVALVAIALVVLIDRKFMPTGR